MCQITIDKQPPEPVMCWWTKPKLGRKKKKESPEMRLQKETKEYSHAKELKVWKTERRLADENTLALDKQRDDPKYLGTNFGLKEERRVIEQQFCMLKQQHSSSTLRYC